MINENLDYSNTIISKDVAVEVYGSRGQKNAYENYRKLTSNHEKGLIKTLNQYYESVERVKVGRAFHYKLGNKREEVATREDKRTFMGVTGESALPYTVHLDIIIADYLSQEENFEPRTLKNWLLDTGIISPELSYAMSMRYNFEGNKELINELYDEKIITNEIDEYTVTDYLGVSEELTSQIKKSLLRLEKTGKMKIKTTYLKKVKTWDYNKEKSSEVKAEIVEISEEEYFTKKEDDRALREKYDLSIWDTMYAKNEGKVKSYRREKNRKTKKYEEDEEKNVIVTKTFYYYMTFGIENKGKNNIVPFYLKLYSPNSLSSYQESPSVFIQDSKKKFKEYRYDRVKEMMEKRIVRRYEDDIKDMKKMGVRQSKRFKPKRYNEVIAQLQQKYNKDSAKGIEGGN